MPALLPFGKLALQHAIIISLSIFFLLSVNCVSVITRVLSLSVIAGSLIQWALSFRCVLVILYNLSSTSFLPNTPGRYSHNVILLI